MNVVNRGECLSDIVAQTKEALRIFGSYTFWDKQPYEVMDIEMIANELKMIDPTEAGSILQALWVYKDPEFKEGELREVANCIMCELDSQPKTWWDSCCEAAPDVG